MLAPAAKPIHGWETGCKVGIEPPYVDPSANAAVSSKWWSQNVEISVRYWPISFLPCEGMQYRLALLGGHTLDPALPEALLSGLMV